SHRKDCKMVGLFPEIEKKREAISERGICTLYQCNSAHIFKCNSFHVDIKRRLIVATSAALSDLHHSSE
ncbi:hypothetical protein WUBG_17498, partial [Wuchereria bancrofti]